MPLHEHTALEQTYVLEGRLEDHEGVCGPGQFPGQFCWLAERVLWYPDLLA